jgi:hypothetical protein
VRDRPGPLIHFAPGKFPQQCGAVALTSLQQHATCEHQKEIGHVELWQYGLHISILDAARRKERHVVLAPLNGHPFSNISITRLGTRADPGVTRRHITPRVQCHGAPEQPMTACMFILFRDSLGPLEGVQMQLGGSLSQRPA